MTNETYIGRNFTTGERGYRRVQTNNDLRPGMLVMSNTDGTVSPATVDSQPIGIAVNSTTEGNWIIMEYSDYAITIPSMINIRDWWSQLTQPWRKIFFEYNQCPCIKCLHYIYLLKQQCFVCRFDMFHSCCRDVECKSYQESPLVLREAMENLVRVMETRKTTN